MAKRVKIEGLADAVNEELKLYNKSIVTGMKKSTRKHMRQMVQETKAQKYKRDTGKFRAAITSRTLKETVNAVEMQWYVRAPHYRLTHLLEDGHSTVNGGRTVAYKFVSKAEKNAVDGYLKEIEAVIRNG